MAKITVMMMNMMMMMMMMITVVTTTVLYVLNVSYVWGKISVF